jgi:beta-phosphoglucomutase-like phosphatase (HAD superfamily)
MSTCEQANRVLDMLSLNDRFDFVATRDDVEHGKPDPEIYNLALEALSVPASECLAIEDSPSGVRAGLAAGVNVVAVATPFTRDLLYEEKLLPDELIVDDPDSLPGTIRRFMDQHQLMHHGGDGAL